MQTKVKECDSRSRPQQQKGDKNLPVSHLRIMLENAK